MNMSLLKSHIDFVEDLVEVPFRPADISGLHVAPTLH